MTHASPHGDSHARALDASYYRDPSIFELEREHVARWDELPEPGDYAALDLFGEPLVVVRDGARKLRVHSRVCRHRAHPVIEGSGNTQRFVCPYHRWTYALDGALKAAPLMDGVAGFDRSSCRLPELRTELWQGFLFANLDPEPQPIGDALAPLAEKFAPYGLAEMVNVGVLEFDSPWNWKVMVDNFMESYHHLGPHAQTLQKSNPAKGTHRVALEGPFSLLQNPAVEGEPAFYVAHVFPTCLVAVFQGLGVSTWYEMQIDRHDHIHLRIHLLLSPELAAAKPVVEQVHERAREVHLEDIPVCQGVQRGIASRLWSPYLLSEQEAALTPFHGYLVSLLAEHVEGAG